MVEGGPLVDRERELTIIAESIDGAIAGRGATLLIEGQAGIGKTSLLAAARQLATTRGIAVVVAAGAVLERDFGFGLARQLFEPIVAGTPEPERRRLLSGAAQLAAPVVVPGDVDPLALQPIDQSAVVHGLYWATANLADGAPLLVSVDDFQWADMPSLWFLSATSPAAWKGCLSFCSARYGPGSQRGMPR